MPYCSKCGRETKALGESKLGMCPSCGLVELSATPIQGKPSQAKHCQYCGKEIPSEAKFCDSCGVLVGAPIPTLPGIPSPPIKVSRIKRKIIIVVMLILLFGIAAATLSRPGPETGTQTTTSPLLQQGQVVKEEKLVQEVATVYPLSDYYPLALKYIPEGASDITVSGTIKELKNRRFDFYAFNRLNYECWKANVSYEAILEVKYVTAYSLSFSPSRQDVLNGLNLVVSNVYLQEPKEGSIIDTTVKVYPFTKYSLGLASSPVTPLYPTEVTVQGTAKEIHGYKFNLYALDQENYNLRDTGRPYTAFYEAKGGESYDFSFILPREKSSGVFYFVVERVEPDVELDVDLSASGSWLAPATLAVEYDVKISWKEKALGGLIATATYGSELEPEVQFLRGFRDGRVMSTFADREFMKAFNAWYCSSART